MSIAHNHPPHMATTACPACMEPVVPHVWTVEEIKALPEFDHQHGWFYGLVNTNTWEGGDEERIELASILPGMGWTSLDPSDVAENWRQIEADLRCYRR